MVSQLRLRLAEQFSEYYSSNSQLMAFGAAVPEFSLPVMVATLACPSAALGYGYLDYICRKLNIDLYLLTTDGLYLTDESLIQGRPAVVLHYSGGHYELVGERTTGLTHFSDAGSSQFLDLLKRSSSLTIG
jgi:hypothetical protein